MIRTRIIVGSMLAAAAVGVLVGDAYLAPWFPCLFVCLIAAAAFGSRELVGLFPANFRPCRSLVLGGIVALIVANWYDTIRAQLAPGLPASGSPWSIVALAFIGFLLFGFLHEMAKYREPGTAIPRLALAVFAVAYIGWLGSCFAQLRWLDHGAVLLALTIFVPKCGDIGAFFTGTFLGRHKMTPILSPKKTWEGFAGGLVASVLAAVVGSFLAPVFAGGIAEAAAFGVVVGIAGVLGDLAESLIKRDGQSKDAAQSIPGFGGVLDVIDSVLFAAPVAYVWFAK